MSKVYFVGGAYMGCWYVRCFLPMLENGWKGNYMGISKSSIKDTNLVTREMLDADVIVFHRANNHLYHHVGKMLKDRGKKIVFDNDDTYEMSDQHPFAGISEKGFKQNKERMNNVINNFIINSDMVTTTTEWLANEYRKIHKNVVVLPNYVNPDDWSEPKRNEGKKVRVGLVGSVAYNHDFEHIKKVLRKLEKDDKIQIVLFGLWGRAKRNKNKLVDKILRKEFAFWDSMKNIEHVPWCEMENYFDTLNDLRLDLMLIPRRENHFNKCKSNVKYLEASMLEVPVIAQGFTDGNSPYDPDLNGQNGILIKDNADWYDAVMEMVGNKAKREIMGHTAKQYVLDNYQIKYHAYKWEEAYKTLFKDNEKD